MLSIFVLARLRLLFYAKKVRALGLFGYKVNFLAKNAVNNLEHQMGTKFLNFPCIHYNLINDLTFKPCTSKIHLCQKLIVSSVFGERVALGERIKGQQQKIANSYFLMHVLDGRIPSYLCLSILLLRTCHSFLRNLMVSIIFLLHILTSDFQNLPIPVITLQVFTKPFRLPF